MYVTVKQDLELIARAIERNAEGVVDWPSLPELGSDLCRQWANEFRHPTPKTLIHNVDVVLWDPNAPMPVRFAAERLQGLIDDLTRRELAALLGAA
jgi:hypothetical protein